MQHDGRALGCVAEFVDIEADGGDTRNSKVPCGHGFAEPFHEGQDEPAHTGIGVEAGADVSRHRGQVPDGVDDALWILRRRADHEHRGIGDGGCHGIDVGSPVRAHRHLRDVEPEVVGPVVECGVGRVGQDDVPSFDVALGAAALARRLDGHEDRLGAARRHETGGLGSVQQPGHGADHPTLDLTQARDGRSVERVVV